MSERIRELTQDNMRLRDMMDVASQRVTRSQRRELRVQREMRQIWHFRFYDRMRIARLEACARRHLDGGGQEEVNGNGGNGNGGNGGNGNGNENGGGNGYNFGVGMEKAPKPMGKTETQTGWVRMVPNEEDKVERFVGGLPDNIQGNVIDVEPTKL
ncbi:hypothetical protein Tco_1459355 [Tanacetum coccineum]